MRVDFLMYKLSQ
jgi:hypothetical protein